MVLLTALHQKGRIKRTILKTLIFSELVGQISGILIFGKITKVTDFSNQLFNQFGHGGTNVPLIFKIALKNYVFRVIKV